MTFKEFSKWANDRACDGQWGLQHAMATSEIYKAMNTVKFFKERFWKKNCESRAIQIVESVKKISEQLKEQKNEIT